MRVARMESQGFWYDPAVVANSIIGRRANRAGKMPLGSVKAQIETRLSGKLAATGQLRAPSRQMVRLWELKDPLQPEKALKSGLIQPSDLLPWAAEYLNSNVTMGQVVRSRTGILRRMPAPSRRVKDRSAKLGQAAALNYIASYVNAAPRTVEFRCL